MKILIISGGISSERKISLLSAKSVKAGLEANEHQVKIFDLKKGYLALKKISQSYDVIFPVIHGEEGEGGKLHKFLASLDKPYVGGEYKSYQQGWYKIPFKEFCDKNRIPTSPWKRIRTTEDIINFGFPSVLKASAGGSSREVIVLKSEKEAKSPGVIKLLELKDELMVESFLPGIEVTVGILNGQALPVIEIRPPEGKWFDYKNKYSGASQEIPHAPSLDKKMRHEVHKTALKIHQLLNLGPYSRIDFIVSNLAVHPKGGRLIPYVLEVNTISGWTSESLFPKAAKAAGLSFEQLVEKLVQISLK